MIIVDALLSNSFATIVFIINVILVLMKIIWLSVKAVYLLPDNDYIQYLLFGHSYKRCKERYTFIKSRPFVFYDYF